MQSSTIVLRERKRELFSPSTSVRRTFFQNKSRREKKIWKKPTFTTEIYQESFFSAAKKSLTILVELWDAFKARAPCWINASSAEVHRWNMNLFILSSLYCFFLFFRRNCLSFSSETSIFVASVTYAFSFTGLFQCNDWNDAELFNMIFFIIL